MYLKTRWSAQFTLILIIQAMIDSTSTTKPKTLILHGMHSKMSKSILQYMHLLTRLVGLDIKSFWLMHHKLWLQTFWNITYSRKVQFITHSIMKQKIGSIVKIMESGQKNSFLLNQEQLHLSITVRSISSGKFSKWCLKLTHWLAVILIIFLSNSVFSNGNFEDPKFLKWAQIFYGITFVLMSLGKIQSECWRKFQKFLRHPSFLWCRSSSWSTFDLNRSYVEGFRLVLK